MDIGVQAGDELIKVSMDRVRLLEKQKQIFLARDTSAPGGDKYIKLISGTPFLDYNPELMLIP